MKEIILIKGKKIDLCLLDKKKHLNNCLEWLNDAQINRLLLAGIFPIYLHNEEEWFNNLGSKENVVMAIMTKEGKHIGNVGLHKIDYISGTAEMGILIGDIKEWGKGIATEAEKLMMEYGFKSLNLQKIYATIFGDNIASLKAAKKNNAIIEGTFKKHLYKNGKYHNIICIAFFRK